MRASYISSRATLVSASIRLPSRSSSSSPGVLLQQLVCPCIISSSTKHNCHCRDALLSSWSGPSLFFQGVLVALASHGFLWRTLLLLRCATSLAARIMRRWIVHFWPCRSSPCSISFLLTAHYELSLVNTPLHNLLRFLLIRIWRFEIRLPYLAASFFLFTPFFFSAFLLALNVRRLSSSFMIDILISLFLYTRRKPGKIHHRTNRKWLIWEFLVFSHVHVTQVKQ